MDISQVRNAVSLIIAGALREYGEEGKLAEILEAIHGECDDWAENLEDVSGGHVFALPGVIEIGELRPYEIELLVQAKLAGGDSEDDPIIKSLRLQYECLMGDTLSVYDIKRRTEAA